MISTGKIKTSARIRALTDVERTNPPSELGGVVYSILANSILPCNKGMEKINAHIKGEIEP